MKITTSKMYHLSLTEEETTRLRRTLYIHSDSWEGSEDALFLDQLLQDLEPNE